VFDQLKEADGNTNVFQEADRNQKELLTESAGIRTNQAKNARMATTRVSK
jgi:hypothetical protein